MEKVKDDYFKRGIGATLDLYSAYKAATAEIVRLKAQIAEQSKSIEVPEKNDKD